MLNEIIRNVIDDKVNDILSDYQNMLGVQSDDIMPYDYLELEQAQNALADAIAHILTIQARMNGVKERVFYDNETDTIVTLSEIKALWCELLESGDLDKETYSDFNYYLNGCMDYNNGALTEIG